MNTTAKLAKTADNIIDVSKATKAIDKMYDVAKATEQKEEVSFC